MFNDLRMNLHNRNRRRTEESALPAAPRCASTSSQILVPREFYASFPSMLQDRTRRTPLFMGISIRFQASNREINKLESLPSSDLLEVELVTLSLVPKLGAWSTNNLECGIILPTKNAIYERIRVQLCNSEK